MCVAQSAVEMAFADGLNLVEVEFPPLQQDYLEDAGSSAYDVSSANVRLAARFAQSFAAEGKVGKPNRTAPSVPSIFKNVKSSVIFSRPYVQL